MHAIYKIVNDIKILNAIHEFVNYSDKKTAVIDSRRFHFSTGSAVKNLKHLSQDDPDPNQAEPEKKQGAGFGNGT